MSLRKTVDKQVHCGCECSNVIRVYHCVSPMDLVPLIHRTPCNSSPYPVQLFTVVWYVYVCVCVCVCSVYYQQPTHQSPLYCMVVFNVIRGRRAIDYFCNLTIGVQQACNYCCIAGAVSDVSTTKALFGFCGRMNFRCFAHIGHTRVAQTCIWLMVHGEEINLPCHMPSSLLNHLANWYY